MRVFIALLTALAGACLSSHSPDYERAPGLDAGPGRSTLDAANVIRMDAAAPPQPAPQPGALLFAEAEPLDASVDAARPQVQLDGPTSVLVVFDKSGSMSAGWSGDETRWTAANKALVGALTPAREQLSIGAILFPQPDGCSVSAIEAPEQYSFMPGSVFLDTWKRTIVRDGVGGSTPLERSFEQADRAIASAGQLLGQHFIVIVITDGEPTCSDDLEALERYPASWLARGITTHVMGLPGSEAAAALLDRIAKAGGSAHHQPIGTPDQLESAVAAVL